MKQSLYTPRRVVGPLGHLSPLDDCASRWSVGRALDREHSLREAAQPPLAPPSRHLQPRRKLKVAKDNFTTPSQHPFPTGQDRPWVFPYKQRIHEEIGEPPMIPPQAVGEAFWANRSESQMADPEEKLFLQWPRSPSPRGAVLSQSRGHSPVGKTVQEQCSLRNCLQRRKPRMQNSKKVTHIAQRHFRKVIRNAVHQCSTIEILDASLATVRQQGGLHGPKEAVELSKVLHEALRRVKNDDKKQCANLLMQILTQEAQQHRFALVSEQGSSDARLERFLQSSGKAVQQTKYPKEQDKTKELESSQAPPTKGESMDNLKQARDELTESGHERHRASTARWLGAFDKVARSGVVQKEHLSRALLMAGFRATMGSWIDEIFKDVSATGLRSMTQDEYLDFVQIYSDREGAHQKSLFESLDTDGSGTISRSELGRVLMGLGIEAQPSLVNEVLKMVDIDESGDLQFQEFETLMSLLRNSYGFTQREKQELHTAFKRFDIFKSGHISVDNIGQVFRWLGYVLTPQEVKSIVEYCDKDASEGIDMEEFLAAAAQLRQAQLKKIREIAQENDQDHSGTLTLAELGHALKALGFNPDKRVIEEVKESLTSDPAFKNHLRQLDLRIEDATDFLEAYRIREGLNSEECAELRTAFRRYDHDGRDRIRSSDADKVLRWYGVSLDSEACARFVAKIDVDRSGYLSEYDFRKILRLEAEASTGTFEDRFKKMDYSGRGTITDKQAERLYQELGLQLDLNRLHANALIVCTSLWQASGDVDMANFVQTCMRRKKFLIANWREKGNFTEAEIQGLQKCFKEYVEASADGEEAPSEITVPAFFQLVDEVLPMQVSNARLQERFVELKKDLDSSRYPTLSFQDFLRMYRQFYDIRDQEIQLKYAEAVQASGFSQSEIEEFRRLFQQQTNEDYLEPSELRRLVGTVLPLSEKRNMTALTTALKEVQRNRNPSFRGRVDFSDFLLIMKKIEVLNPREKAE